MIKKLLKKLKRWIKKEAREELDEIIEKEITLADKNGLLPPDKT